VGDFASVSRFVAIMVRISRRLASTKYNKTKLATCSNCYIIIGVMKKNYKTQTAYVNVLIKGRGNGPDQARKIRGDAMVYDSGAIVITCEDDDFIIIACNDDREVFEPIDKNGMIGVI